MFGKRGQGLSITSIILIILALIVLVVVYFMFAEPSNTFISTIREQLGIGTKLIDEVGTK